jgi:hypothetical protein
MEITKMAKKHKKPSTHEMIVHQKRPPTAAERLISNAKFLAESVMDEPLRITHIPQNSGIYEVDTTIKEYLQTYDQHVASIIGETENNCRLLMLPGCLEVQNYEGEIQPVPFEHSTLVYVVFDPAKYDRDDINIMATQILADAGSTDQAVWDAAVVSSMQPEVINNR